MADGAAAAGGGYPHARHEDAMDLERQMREIALRRQQMDVERLQMQGRRNLVTPPNSARRSASRSSMILPVHDPPGATHVEDISMEARRREMMPKTAALEMKEAMKKSWTRDSTLVSGFFLKPETGRGGTFGRAQRFNKPVGMKEQYYLSNDVQRMQSRDVRLDRRKYVVATRGHIGTNVNSHWNDSKGGGAPGPGAYTPRFGQVSFGVGH
jgi:hypothetical protein